MSPLVKKIKASREAADVSRTHTIRTISDHRISGHCYNILAMLMILHPNPSKELIFEALFHDMGERMFGDPPASAKMQDHELKEKYDRLEYSYRKSIGLTPKNLSLDEQRWLKFLDMLEFFLWCRDEMSMGNKNVQQMHDTAVSELESLVSEVPHELQSAWTQIAVSDWNRTSNFMDR